MSQDNVSSGVATPVNGSILEKEEQQQEPVLQDVLPDRTFKDYLGISFFCLLVAFGGFVFGFDTGTIGGFLSMSDFLERFGQHNENGYYMSNVRTGLIVAIFNVGCAFGAIFLGKVADVWGRRLGLVCAMCIYVVGIIVQISSPRHKWYQYFIGRIITGVAVGMVSVVSPLFISEVSPKQIRGTLVCCFQLMITLGIFLGYCTNYGTKSYSDSRQWRIPLGLCFAWALMLVGGMAGMPESPRYLVQKNRIDEAKKSIAKSNRVSVEDPFVYTEIQLIHAGIEKEALAGKASWKDLVTGKPKIFRRVIMGIMLQSLQQLTGDNYFFYYGTTIFKAVGLEDSFETAIVIGVINFASTFVGIWVIERFGRRLCLLVGAAAMSVCFLIYALLGSQHLYRSGYDHPHDTYKPTGNAMIFITSLYIFIFASTWAGGVWVVISESYPLRIRSKAIAVANASNWLWGFLISFFTPFITAAIHFYYGFVFLGCLVFSFFYVYFFVYETKGLSLEEVDIMYASGILPLKSGSWVPPSVENMVNATHYGDAIAAEAAEAEKASEEQV